MDSPTMEQSFRYELNEGGTPEKPQSKYRLAVTALHTWQMNCVSHRQNMYTVSSYLHVQVRSNEHSMKYLQCSQYHNLLIHPPNLIPPPIITFNRAIKSPKSRWLTSIGLW
jgi:hypothetical protein